jgi:PadR family transcriptional regulator PadR
MPDAELDLLRGTLDLLILKALAWGPAHGYAVARWIEQATAEALPIEDGSLYPGLHRLEARGLVEAGWGLSENNRRARFYRLTAAGRRALRTETDRWERFAQAMFGALRSPAGPRPADA